MATKFMFAEKIAAPGENEKKKRLSTVLFVEITKLKFMSVSKTSFQRKFAESPTMLLTLYQFPK